MLTRNIWLISAISIIHIICTQAMVYGESPNMPPESGRPPISGHASVETTVVARVNGTEIVMSQLMNKIRNLTSGKQQGEELTPLLAEQIKQKALHMLITEELAYQHAKAINITVKPDDISKKVAELKKSMKSEEHFLDYLKLKNIASEEELKIQLERFLAVQAAIKQEVDQKITVNEDDIKKAYENNIESFTDHERLDILDVIFFLDPEADESMQKAREIRLRIINDHDGNPSLLPAGDFFAVQEYIPLNEKAHKNLYKAAKETPRDTLSDVLNIDGTLHVVKVTGYRPEKVKTLAEVKPELEGQIKGSLKKTKLEEWKANLHTDAKIEIIDFAVQ